METWKFLLKILLMLLSMLVFFAPLLLEWGTFLSDKSRRISYKRLRMVIYTLVYTLAVTVALVLLKQLLTWVGELPIIRWLVQKVAAQGRFYYGLQVYSALLVNVLIGLLFWLLSKLVRIGMKKMDLLQPKKKDGTFSWRQRLERGTVRFFYKEIWFFTARVLKGLGLVLTALYGLYFAAQQLPVLFTDDWVPYDILTMLLESGYLFPMLTLLVIWQCYFFLEGIRRTEKECPELLEEDGAARQLPVDLDAMDQEVRKQFRDFYVCDLRLSEQVSEQLAQTDHKPEAELIAEAVEQDARHANERKECYVNSLDQLLENNNSILINGGFFTGFSTYFLRYLAGVVARGDNVIFVCNTDAQVDQVHGYLTTAFSQMSSIFCRDFGKDGVNFDDPIWRIAKVAGQQQVVEDAAVKDSSMLVTTLNYLCSNRFEGEHTEFIALTDTVVFVDTLETVNRFSRQMAVLNTRLKHIAKVHAAAAKAGGRDRAFRVRYMYRPIRYICFDDSKVAGLDKVLKNLLAVELEAADPVNYRVQPLVRCYRYEGALNARDRRACPQFFNTEEEIGPLLNMAVLCLAKGASNVTVFAEGLLPYENLVESMVSNAGNLSVKVDADKVSINRYQYHPDGYCVMIVMDSGDNLPEAIRRCMASVSEKPTLIMLFSRPYMLRDYYLSNINSLWGHKQIQRIPVETGTVMEMARKVLVKANAGGITEKEILRMAMDHPQFADAVAARDVNSILRTILKMHGVEQESRIDLYNFFEYATTQQFDENGVYDAEYRVLLRRQGRLFDLITGRDMAVLVTEDDELQLPVPRGRLTQNYIAGQNLLHEGKLYFIQKIDSSRGRVYAKLAVGGKNEEAYQYIQNRQYHVELEEEKIEHVFPPKHVVLQQQADAVAVEDVFVSVFRAPMEVLTKGYYVIDPHTMAKNADINEYHDISEQVDDVLAKQTYRRYGKMSAPFCSSDSVYKHTDMQASGAGALMMTIRLTGNFGPQPDRTMALAAAMLNEVLHSMFPSVADSVVVCPVLHKGFDQQEARHVLRKQPKLDVTGENNLLNGKDFGLVILEDSDQDLGVVSVLATAGDDMLQTLFGPVLDYLNWYHASAEKNDYLYYGLDHEPECFDFTALRSLAQVLGDDKHDVHFQDIEQLIERESCDFCGKRYPKNADLVELEDGRKMCKHCAENLVGNNKRALKAHLERAKRFLENTYGIELDDDYEFCFESTVKIANTLKHNRALQRRGADLPLRSYVDDKKKVHIEYAVPSVNLSELLVRELTHVWQLKHVPDVAEDLAEGHIALVGIQYLRFLNEHTLAAARTGYFESANTASGEGYRKLVRQLLQKPQYHNNPFRYLLESSGMSDQILPPPTPRIIEEEELGPQYTPENPDRTAGEISYFYYPRLTASRQRAYDDILAAVRSFADSVTVNGFDIDEVSTITDAVAFDHPELFYWTRYRLNMRGSQLQLTYGVTAEEAQVLQKRIDEVVPGYLEGITDDMSAYDVALRLHSKLIAMVDYDTLALNEETRKGGPSDTKVDNLRTICGVFLNKKAVCEGYARALQYLLQKCGIECAEAAGYIRKENGETEGGHAWNIVKIDGAYYYMDTTWDDGSNTVQTVKSPDSGFNYFCITTEELLRTRDLQMCPVEMPDCTAVRANYFHHNNLVLDSYDPARIKEIARAAAQNQSQAFRFKCAGKAVFDAAYQRLCVDGEDCFDALKAAAKADKKILTTSYTYKPDKHIYTITVFFKYKS